VTQDITDQKLAHEREIELEQQLLQAQKFQSLGTLASGIAHDFNNILQAILGFSKIAKKNLNGDREILARCMEEIDRGGHRARDLVDQILIFSRKSDVEVIPQKLQPLIEEAIRFMRSTIPVTVRIDSNIDPDCSPVVVNATQIHQLVTNLCTNAMHAMEDEGGVLSVTLEPITIDSSFETLSGRIEPGEFIQFTVVDSGMGIDLVTMNQILDPFFTTKEVGKGTGLGLSMVYGITKRMAGGLQIESEIGKGTTIIVTLPVYAKGEAPAFVETENTQPDLRGSGHVMIVDDEVAITAFATIMLESSGFTVEAFNDISSALDAAKARPGRYDVAILDYTMPIKTGVELAKDFEYLIPNMPVVLVTGLMDNSELDRLKPKNVVALLKKPYELNALIEAITSTS
jgi:nitrogen-specific signal transduction histidine kinase/CheY-like chemotaxis protein